MTKERFRIIKICSAVRVSLKAPTSLTPTNPHVMSRYKSSYLIIFKVLSTQQKDIVVNRLKILMLSIMCAVFCVACTQPLLKVEVAPKVLVEIPTPERLKLVEGVYATYTHGTLFIDTQYLEGISGEHLLDQIYGGDTPKNENTDLLKKAALKDAESFVDISNSKYRAFLINHRMGYELLVMAPKDEKFVTYITGKNISTKPIYDSIKE